LENGEGLDDNFDLWYRDGVIGTWTQLDPMPKTSADCTTSVGWVVYSIVLPSTATGNSDVQFGYTWTNDGDGLGSNPSCAVDNCKLSLALPPDSIEFSSSDTLICENNCVDFYDNSTGNPTSWWWDFPGATPSYSTDQNPTNICYGIPGTYNVTLIIEDSTIGGIQDNFEIGTINTNVWSNVSNGAVSNGCGSAGGSLLALYFDSITGERSATTVPVNTVPCSSINFCLYIGNSGSVGSCENADTNENVVLEYSVDSGLSWVLIQTFLQSDWDALNSWQCFSIPIPAATYTANTMFRWIQHNYSACLGCDNWSLDNVNIDCQSNDTLTLINYITVDACGTSTTAFTASDTLICENDCIDFYDNSTGSPTSWWWDFPGGTPSYSTDQNPTNICYGFPGTYSVTLMTTSSTSSDTLTQVNYITVDVCSGVSENESADYRAYPNPGNSSFTLVNTSAEPFQLSVLNVLGEQVIPSRKLKGVSNTIDVESLASGLYLLQIKTENDQWLLRWLKL
jgi:PKD repeat protein